MLSDIGPHVVWSEERSSSFQGLLPFKALAFRRGWFTALLMAVLMPSLQRARKQAKAVACQSNLRQWGTLYAAYTAENDGYLIPLEDDPRLSFNDPWWATWRWFGAQSFGALERALQDPTSSPSFTATRRILYCPMATKLAEPWTPPPIWVGGGNRGGTFQAWHANYGAVRWGGSYGMQETAHSTSDPVIKPIYWMTNAVKNANAVPVFLDSGMSWVALPAATYPPPPFDSIPTVTLETFKGFRGVCINRHDGGINVLFLDWSVRKVGLKELWTLKWCQDWDTAGPWTRRGGARPEDWPQWMRAFKDY